MLSIVTVRIVFSSRPAFGHVFAIAPLARAAQDAGHQVVFASGEEFLPRLKGWGFETASVGGDVESGFQRAAALFPELLQQQQPEFGARMFVDLLGPASLRDMSRVVSEVHPDVVVYEATDVGAAVAAAAAGIPVVCHSISLWVEGFMRGMQDRFPVLWQQAGLEPTVDLTDGNAFIDIWPRSMQPAETVQPDELWQLRPVTWGDPSADIPAWIDDAKGPFVFVTLGTIFWGKELLGKIIEALADIDCDALVLAGVDATPDDFTPDDRIRISGFVNQAEVLKRADLVIHHGGAGTMLGTLSRGTPALVLGAGADRPYTAAALHESGAGISLDPETSTARDIAAAVTTLFGDSNYRDRAVAIKQEIEGMPSPREVVDRLEEFISDR